MAVTETPSPIQPESANPQEPGSAADPKIPKLSPEKEAALASQVKDLFYKARSARRPLITQWVKNYQIMRNRTWGDRAAWMPKPEVPEIFPIVSSLTSWMTDQRPTFDVAPAAEPHSPFAEFYDQLAHDLKLVLQTNWQVEKFDLEIEKLIWDGWLYGIGILKSSWDQNRVGGLGNAMISRIDPFTFYPDPQARNMDDANYFVEVKTLPAQEVERRFPGALKRIGEEAYQDYTEESPTVISETTGAGTQPKANPGAISPATAPRYGLPGQTDRMTVNDTRGITLFEAWLRTPVHTDAFPSLPEDESALSGPPDKERIYDGWRCVVIAGNCVLMDEPADELWNHGQHPYDRYVPIDTGEFFSYSMVEMLSPTQLSINRLLAAMEHNIWLTGNPVFLEDNRAGIQRTKITNKPGQRISINAGGRAEWLNPPPFHEQFAMSLIGFYIGEMERISGLSGIVRGATPTGRNAQGVLDSVQEAAFVRIRQALRNLEVALRGSGEKVASLVCEFYDKPRLVAMIGPSGEKTALALHHMHFYTPSLEGRVPMRFQLLVSAGSQTSTSRSARVGEADALFAMGALDTEAVLEAHDWPNRNMITQRIREMQAANGTLGQPPGARQRTQRKS